MVSRGCLQRWVRCSIVTLASFTSFLPAQTQSSDTPRLAYLAVRSGDRPVELSPPFSPTHFIYVAVLDFASPAFQVDVAPAAQAALDASSVPETHVVDPGGEQQVDVLVRSSADISATMQYTVRVRRLDGTEVHLQSVLVPGAALSPIFAQNLLEYFVEMPAEQDLLTLVMVPIDRGQTVDVRGFLPSSSGALAFAPQARRLQAADTTPDAAFVRRFPVGVGQSRAVSVRVSAACGDPSLNATYRFKAFRARCPAHRPLYAPDVRQCASTCNEGFFSDAVASRCEACSSGCLRCGSWDDCRVCEPSQWQSMRFIFLSSGSCKLFVIPWLRILSAAALVVLALGVLACCVCACCPCGEPRRGVLRARRRRRPEEEEEGLESHRLLESGDGSDGSGGSGAE